MRDRRAVAARPSPYRHEAQRQPGGPAAEGERRSCSPRAPSREPPPAVSGSDSLAVCDSFLLGASRTERGGFPMRPALLVVLLLSSACAFSKIPIRLGTEPTPTRGLGGGDGREIVVATPFVDGGEIRERCGMQKNNMGMDTANAVCSEDPALWFARALEAGLKASGFTVVGESAKPSALRVQGTLLKI